jgi:hypothetical protein
LVICGLLTPRPTPDIGEEQARSMHSKLGDAQGR